jgi:putative FmdB family regulatory protein
MPIYEFRCLKCGKFFELLKLKKEDDAVRMKCPKCASPEIERVLSTVNVGTPVRGSGGTKTTVKNCSSGSCGTIEIPGRK